MTVPGFPLIAYGFPMIVVMLSTCVFTVSPTVVYVRSCPVLFVHMLLYRSPTIVYECVVIVN